MLGFPAGSGFRRAASLLMAAMLGGCAAGGFDLDKAAVDPSIVTGGLAADVAPATQTQKLDEATIRNAVSSADPDQLKGGPVRWVNTQTGSRGAINSLVEEKQPGGLCRRFTTSRESFDGVALYKGEVCMVAPGAWRLQGFGAL